MIHSFCQKLLILCVILSNSSSVWAQQDPADLINTYATSNTNTAISISNNSTDLASSYSSIYSAPSSISSLFSSGESSIRSSSSSTLSSTISTPSSSSSVSSSANTRSIQSVSSSNSSSSTRSSIYSSSSSLPSSISSSTRSSSSTRISTSSRSSITSDPSSSSEDSEELGSTRTSVIEGKTILSNHYTTITYSATATGSLKNSSSDHGLSKKNKNVVIGVVVGVGVPLLVAIMVIIYMFCIRSKKTDFIDSNGNVVTAYRRNKVTKLWHGIIGKNANEDEYDSNVPIGSDHTLDDDLNNDISSSSGTIDSRNKKSTLATANNSDPANRLSESNDLLLDEEKYYDDQGNELNAKMY